MKRREFFSVLSAVAASAMAFPSIVNAKAKRKKIIVLPETPAVGEMATLIYIGNDKWVLYGATDKRFNLQEI